MIRLIDASKVRARMSLLDDDGVNASIESAIDAALIRTSSILATGFDEGTAEDLFFVDKYVQVVTNGMYLLRLSHGFVRADEDIKVYVGRTLAEAMDPLNEVPLSIKNLEKGFFYYPPEIVEGQYVRVTYSHGFLETEYAPEWLVEAILCYTAKVLSSQQIYDPKVEISGVYKFLETHAGEIIMPHLRSDSAAIYPMV